MTADCIASAKICCDVVNFQVEFEPGVMHTAAVAAFMHSYSIIMPDLECVGTDMIVCFSV